MKRSGMLLPGAAIALWGAACAVPSAAAGPRVVVGPTRHDFGTMETDGAGRHAFVLGNTGDSPLVVRQARSSCGCCTCACAACLPEGGRILPGQSAEVTLEWAIRQYTGEFRQTATLATNDPAQPEVTLEVVGRITPTVRVVPTQLVFTRVDPGQPVVGELRLYGYRAEPLRILRRRFSDASRAGSFRVDCRPLDNGEVSAEPDARSGWLVRVEVDRRVAAAPFREHLVLATNVDAVPELEIPVEGTLGSEIAVAGFGWDERSGVLTLGTIAAERGATRRVQVVVRGAHAAHVTLRPVSVVPDLLHVEVGSPRQLGQGAVCQIPVTIRVQAGARPANHLGSKASDPGRIVFETGHPRERELRILVRFAVRPDPAR